MPPEAGGRRFPGGQQVIWISSLGRRSGEWRRTPLLAVGEGSAGGANVTACVVAGSNAGQAKVPGWVFNVSESPSGFLAIGGTHWRVRFEEATGDVRDELYGRLTRSWKPFATYTEHAQRYVPVFRVVLEEPVTPGPARPATPS